MPNPVWLKCILYNLDLLIQYFRIQYSLEAIADFEELRNKLMKKTLQNEAVMLDKLFIMSSIYFS